MPDGSEWCTATRCGGRFIAYQPRSGVHLYSSSAQGQDEQADLVFRGVISEYRYPDEGYKFAVLQVSRVWKGQVGPAVEISTFPGYSDAPCSGFSTKLWEVGADELVFARMDQDQHAIVGYWSGTTAAKDSPYLRKLGAGKPPRHPN